MLETLKHNRGKLTVSRVGLIIPAAHSALSFSSVFPYFLLVFISLVVTQPATAQTYKILSLCSKEVGITIDPNNGQRLNCTSNAGSPNSNPCYATYGQQLAIDKCVAKAQEADSKLNRSLATETAKTEQADAKALEQQLLKRTCFQASEISSKRLADCRALASGKYPVAILAKAKKNVRDLESAIKVAQNEEIQKARNSDGSQRHDSEKPNVPRANGERGNKGDSEENISAAEAARLKAEKAEKERIEIVRKEAERIEAQRQEALRKETIAAEAARLKAEKAEKERIEIARKEAERFEIDRARLARVENEKKEKERLYRQRIEQLSASCQSSESGSNNIVSCSELINLNPEPKLIIAARFARAKGLIHALLFDKALSDVNAALSIAPDQIDLLKTRAELNYKLDKLQAAVQDYDRLIDVEPQNGEWFFHRGSAYLSLGKFSAAAGDFSRSLVLNPTNKLALKYRGVSFSRSGEIDRAISDLHGFLDADPDDVEAKNILQRMTGGNISAAKGKGYIKSALIIGNSRYLHVPQLANPRNDSADLAKTLQEIGFQNVIVKNDLTRDQMYSALKEFSVISDKSDWSVIYYSGHGIELNGNNYFVPTDAKLQSERDVLFDTVDLNTLMSSTDGSKKLRMVIVDACRDNPFLNSMKRNVASRSTTTKGLAQVEPDVGVLVVYAARHGQVALDGDGRNSPFMDAFLRNIRKPNLELRRLFDNVRDDVLSITRGKQQPFVYGSVSGGVDFFFVQN